MSGYDHLLFVACLVLIVFLATELVRDRRETLTWRYPVAVSASFGLLHGFGFASVLTEIGLPQIEVPTALLFFNVGVEAGQIVFLLALIGARLLVGSVMRTSPRPRRLQRPGGYVAGVLASYWLVGRVAGFWP